MPIGQMVAYRKSIEIRDKLIEKNYTFYSSEAIKFINNFHSFKVYKKSWLNLVEELIK